MYQTILLLVFKCSNFQFLLHQVSKGISIKHIFPGSAREHIEGMGKYSYLVKGELP